MLPDIERVENIIRQVANEEILTRFNKISYSIKADGSLLTEADLAADQRIQQHLFDYCPEISFLSEEMRLSQQEELLQTASQLWCLDPLDGTSNFAAGIPLFATSLALIKEGEVVMAVTYDPLRNEMFSAIKGQGAFLNGEKLSCKPSGFSLNQAVAIVDLKRLTPTLAQRLATHAPYKSQRNLGACVLEWAWMAANRGHIYLHGGMKLWDLAAGTLLLSEAGGYASTLDGESVFRASMTPRSVVISPDQTLYSEWMDYLVTDVTQ
jgi:myo-inositol-1(or 4)-monophosphatase